jgi:hypothetical protein
MTKKFQLPLVAKLGDQKFGHPIFPRNAQKNFNHLPKIFNHSMGHGLISTIYLVIDFF